MKALEAPVFPTTVRLTLVRGQTRITTMELGGQEPVKHVVVGSSSQCHWRVCAPGVKPRHFRLVWARSRLRIEECWSGGVRVDGRDVGARLELPAAARLEFGDAILQIEPVREAPPTVSSIPTEAGNSGRPA